MTKNEFLDKLAAELGVDKAKLEKTLDQEEGEGNLALTVDDAADAGPRGAYNLVDYMEGKLDKSRLPDVLGDIFDGLPSRMEVRDAPPDQKPKRPKEPGLIEAIDAVANTAVKRPAEMAIAHVDRPRLHYLRDRIFLYRGTLAQVLGFSQILLADLAVDENEAKGLLSTYYDKVRKGALSDARLGTPLQPAEDYLYGSAKQGADTRAKNQQTAKALDDKAQKKAQVQVGAKARKQMADNLTALVDDLVSRLDAGSGEGEAGTDPANQSGQKGRNRP